MFTTKILLKRFSVSHLIKSHRMITGRLVVAMDNEDENFVIVRESENNNNRMKFPTVWLRDNCQCNECFHLGSHSRQIKWDNFNTKIKIQQISADQSKNIINIKWSDEHSSAFEMGWLKERQFNPERRTKYLNEFYRPEAIHWKGEDFQKIAQTFRFNDIMINDDVLRRWLEALAVWGVAIINDAPIDKGVVRQLAERVGFIRRTTYGEEFVVQLKPEAKNFAYHSSPLPLHTDLPYYEYKPGVNILHCMVQSESTGGNSLLTDAFYIADRLKVEYSDYFKILTETLVDWTDIGSEDDRKFYNIWRAPVICLNSEGKYARINHNVPQRDSHFTVDLDDVIPWYDANAMFVKLATEDAFAFKMKPGDVLTFNNIRLLHGRSGYADADRNVRCIVGAYLDWDIIYSKLRVLKLTK